MGRPRDWPGVTNAIVKRKGTVMARRHWTWGLAISVALLGCNQFDRLDSTCTPDEPSIDESEDCIRANGRGPLLGAECDAIQEEAGSDPTWAEVEAVLTDETRGSCTLNSLGCHGEPGGGISGIAITGTGQELYDSLLSTTGTQGRPYVIPDDPEASWMHCNVRNRNFEGSVGKAMPLTPQGLPDDADVLLIEDWILQGAKGPTD